MLGPTSMNQTFYYTPAESQQMLDEYTAMRIASQESQGHEQPLSERLAEQNALFDQNSKAEPTENNDVDAHSIYTGSTVELTEEERAHVWSTARQSRDYILNEPPLSSPPFADSEDLAHWKASQDFKKQCYSLPSTASTLSLAEIPIDNHPTPPTTHPLMRMDSPPRSTRCQLLEIPMEIREMIYRHAFPEMVTLTREVEEGQSVQEPVRFYWDKPDHSASGLLRTCKIIRAEALPWIWKCTNLDVRKFHFQVFIHSFHPDQTMYRSVHNRLAIPAVYSQTITISHTDWRMYNEYLETLPKDSIQLRLVHFCDPIYHSRPESAYVKKWKKSLQPCYAGQQCRETMMRQSLFDDLEFHFIYRIDFKLKDSDKYEFAVVEAFYHPEKGQLLLKDWDEEEEWCKEFTTERGQLRQPIHISRSDILNGFHPSWTKKPMSIGWGRGFDKSRVLPKSPVVVEKGWT